MTQAKTEHKCRVINDLLLDLENEGSIPFTRSIPTLTPIYPNRNKLFRFLRSREREKVAKPDEGRLGGNNSTARFY